MNHFAIRDTEDYPGTGNLSNADFAADVFRADLGVKHKPIQVPDEWADKFTPEQWQQFSRDRFSTYHSEGWTMSPEYWLEQNT
jgi:hypothetical protein